MPKRDSTSSFVNSSACNSVACPGHVRASGWEGSNPPVEHSEGGEEPTLPAPRPGAPGGQRRDRLLPRACGVPCVGAGPPRAQVAAGRGRPGHPAPGTEGTGPLRVPPAPLGARLSLRPVRAAPRGSLGGAGVLTISYKIIVITATGFFETSRVK